ncbi:MULTISPECIES: hypothetical protein [unclassified Mammaliicoccus]|uniref:hypothetical protein n=1 Tax=unclassified Mammaliicoccus TaxID=2803851 RepID=UPI001EFC2CBD|nr:MULTISPECIES: hypothetical protein [unclassified Mammaliicoccus]
MNTLTELGERIIKTEKQLDQYKTAHNKLTSGLKEAVAESIKYKRERDELSNKLDKECNDNYKLEGQLNDMTKQRDSLIGDVEKLREEVKSLNRETTKYFEHWQEIFGIYSKLTEHIKDKALNNPSEHRYFRLVHFIDDLEAGTDD